MPYPTARYEPTTGMYGIYDASGSRISTVGTHEDAARAIDPSYQTQPTVASQQVTTLSSGAGVGNIETINNNIQGMTPPTPTTPTTPAETAPPKTATDIATEALANESLTPAQLEEIKVTKRAEAEKKARDDQYKAMVAKLEPALASALSSINNQYNQLIAKQEELNRKYEALNQTAGIRSGGAKYSTEIQNQFNKADIEAGLDKVSNIISQRDQAIAQAKAAYASQEFTLMSKYNDDIAEINKNLNAQLDKLAEEGRKATEALTKQTRLANLSDSVSKLMTGGETDINKILKTLNDAGGKYTAKEVSDEISNLSKTSGVSNLTGEVKNYYLLKDAGTLPSSISTLPETNQLSAYLAMVKNAEAGAGTLKWQKVGTDKFGDDIYGFVNEKTGTISYAGGTPVGGGGGAIAGVTAPSEEISTFASTLPPDRAQVFNKLSTQEQTNVMGLINGDILLSDIAKGGVKGTKAAQTYNAAAMQVDPTYSENTNKQRYTFKVKWNDTNGKAYQTRVGVNTALGHLSRLAELTAGLSSNTDFQKANNLKNWIAANINSDKLSDPNDPNSPTLAEILGQFSDTVDLLSMEIARAYKGGVPDQMEISRQMESINASKPKNVIESIINNKGVLMSGLLASQGEEYKKVMGKYPDDSIINPDVVKELEKAGVDVTKIRAKLKAQINPPKPLITNDTHSGITLPSATSTNSYNGIILPF